MPTNAEMKEFIAVPAEVTNLPTPAKRTSLVEKVASRFSVDPGKLLGTLKSTAFRQHNDAQISDEQMMALLVVADQYGLNPFTREIYAFPDKKNGIVPVVGVDGWSRIINEHPQSDGFEFRESEKIVIPEGGKPCPEWMEIVIYRKDRSHPTIVREYIDEVYRAPFKRDDRTISGPWQTHTKRFFRHKVFIQGSRIAYGFGGIYDEDEAERIIDAQVVSVHQTTSSAITRPRARSEETPLSAASPIPDAPLHVDHKALGDSVVGVLKAKLEAGALSESDLFKRFNVEGWDRFTTHDLEKIKTWIADPTC